MKTQLFILCIRGENHGQQQLSTVHEACHTVSALWVSFSFNLTLGGI